MTSAAPSEKLLELLERALHGGLMGPVPEGMSRRQALEEQGDGLEDYEEDFGDFDDELEEDEGDYEFEEEDGGGVATLDAERAAGSEPTYRASPKGAQIVYVAGILQRWLRNCPEGPLEIGAAGGSALASLLCGWSTTVIHALAREPLTLAELDRAVKPIPEREVVAEHVESMRMVGQAEVLEVGGETRYALTDWMREGIAPIAAAAWVEVHYPEEQMAPPDVLDVEAAFQMALPLLRLPPDLRGTCRLGVQIPGGPPLMAGATVEVDRGAVVTSSALLDEDPETFATGSPRDWLDTVIDPAAGKIKAGGDTRLAGALIEGLHERLFTPAQLTPPGR
jgi:DNA-binding HxlR family transcriptional regulator